MNDAAGPQKVVAVENLDVVRLGLLTLPMTRPDAVATIEVHPSVATLDLTRPAPDVLVVDYWLGHEDESVVPHLPDLVQWSPHVLLYTSEERPARLRAAMRTGVSGLCLKTDGLSALADAIQDVAVHGTAFSGPLAQALLEDDALGARLTERECEVLEGLATGLTIADIADQLVLSVKTVQTHAENIRRKYTADGSRANRARMLLEAQRDGYLGTPSMKADPGDGRLFGSA